MATAPELPTVAARLGWVLSRNRPRAGDLARSDGSGRGQRSKHRMGSFDPAAFRLTGRRSRLRAGSRL
jgi:hypothetical protein